MVLDESVTQEPRGDAAASAQGARPLPGWREGPCPIGDSTLPGNPTWATAQRLLAPIVERFAASAGCITLRDSADTGHLIVVASVGKAPAAGTRVPIGDPLFGHAVDDRSLPPAPDATAPSGHQRADAIDDAVCCPLTIEGRSIGALVLYRLGAGAQLRTDIMGQGTLVFDLLALGLEKTYLGLEQTRHVEALARRVQETQDQLLRTDRMASIGQLAAGVAHEINNPIGYVFSNLSSLEGYIADLLALLDRYGQAERSMGEEDRSALARMKAEVDLAFLKEDVFSLMGESKEGITRVKNIVQDLKDFSHGGAEEEWVWADLHRGLDSTLNIVHNELKYKARIVRDYGTLPKVECLPFQLNQVFMNLLVNAADAIESEGAITVRTGTEDDHVWVEVADNGCGIAPHHQHRIFDPFFTTKPVGKGTGLGLSLAYGIVSKHHGRIDVASEVGKGSSFRMLLPIRQPAARDAS